MSVFSKFQRGISKGASFLQGAFDRVAGRPALSDGDLLELEEALIASDFGPVTTDEILEEVKTAVRTDKNFRGAELASIARSVLERTLDGSEGRLRANETKPETICLIGVNGSGKTTTCAKLGRALALQGKAVTLAACDTFRAAATEQLKNWAARLQLDVVSGHHGSDSAAVAFDAHASAQAKGSDYLILDTAGRLHVKDHLMEELAKLKRVLQKRDDRAPRHSWLVIDGSTGTNGLSQARVFHQKFGVTGLIATKLDGTSKAGALVSIYRELGIPIYFVGLGEQPDDLQPFCVDAYLDSLLPSQPTQVKV